MAVLSCSQYSAGCLDLRTDRLLDIQHLVLAIRHTVHFLWKRPVNCDFRVKIVVNVYSSNVN